MLAKAQCLKILQWVERQAMLLKTLDVENKNEQVVSQVGLK